MKEAAGEANITVITIVLIGVVAAVGLTLIPRLMGNAKAKACCTDAGWFVSGSYCCDPTFGSACNSTFQYSKVTISSLNSSDLKSNSRFYNCMKGD